MKRLAVAALALVVATQAVAQDAPPPPPDVPGYPPPQPYPGGQPQGYPPPPGYPPQAYPPQSHPQGGYYRRPQQRDTWYIGFGIGLLTCGGRLSGEDVNGVTRTADFGEGLSQVVSASFNFKVGATLTPQLLLGFDLTGIRTQGKVDVLGSSLDIGTQVSNYDVMVTWFPMERGFFLRGGAGLAILTFDAVDQGVRASRSFTGAGAVVGAGYAFWLGRSFNLTLNLDLSGQTYGSGTNKPTGSSAVNGFVGFDWY